MGLLLDLAVAALALIVIGSLATLAWTLGVSASRAVRNGRERAAKARRMADAAEAAVVRTSTNGLRGEPRDR